MSDAPVVPERLTLTTDGHLDPDATVTIDEDTIGRMDVHRELFNPAQSDLPEALIDAAGTITPVEGGFSDIAEKLRARDVSAVDGQFEKAVAKALVQEDRRDGSGVDGWNAWFLVLYFIRYIDNQPAGSLEDVFDGPISLLGELEHPPTVEVQLPGSFVHTFKSTQRTRLFGYLRRLTPGVNVRITGTRITLREVVDQHAEDLPADVNGPAQTTKLRSSSSRPASQREAQAVAQDALEQINLTERNAGTWRVLTRVCTHENGEVRQAALQDDTLMDDVDDTTIRQRTRTLAQHDLVQKDTRGRNVFLTPTPAGQEALALAQTEAPSLLGCWSTPNTPDNQYGTQTDAETEPVSDPPNSSQGPCTPNACEGSQDGDRQTAAGQGASRGAARSSSRRSPYLGLHEHHGAAAAVPAGGGIALEDRSLSGSVDDTHTRWSHDPSRNEVVVEATASPVQAFTAVRLCDALLSTEAESQVLTRENLNGGPGKFDLEGLAINEPYLMRAGRTIGWLKNADAEGKRFLDRLRQARNELKQACRTVAENADNGVYDADTLSSILQKAHGLQGVLTAVYDLLGYDVVRKLRVPEPSKVDPEELAHFVIHQTACSSRYGLYTAFRYLFEDDDEKREDTLDSTPSVGPDDYRGTVSAPWVIVGPGVDRYEEPLKHPEQYLELQEDAESFFEFVLDIDVTTSHRRSAVAELVNRVGPSKNLHSNEQITTQLYALTSSTVGAAAVVGGMGQADEPREMDHGDLEFGLYRLEGETSDGKPYVDRASATDIVPDIGSRTVSKVVWALLRRDEPLSTSDLADAADCSTETLRRIRREENWFEQLETLGFLDVEETGPGKANKWSFSLIGVGDQDVDVDEEADDGLAALVFDRQGWAGEAWRIDEAIHEYLVQHTDETDADLPIALGSDIVQEVAHGPFDRRAVQSFLQEIDNTALHSGIRLLSRLIDQQLPSDNSSTVRLGREPDAVAQQQSLTAAAAD